MVNSKTGNIAENKKNDLIAEPFLITTPHLVLKPLRYQDMHIANSSIIKGINSIKMWLPWVVEHPKQAESAQISAGFQQEAKDGEAYHFMVYSQGDQEFIGMVSIYLENAIKKVIKLGYWFKEVSNSQVFIESIKTVLQFAFNELGVLKVIIPCVAGNFHSEIAAKELKFKLKRIEFVDGNSLKIYELKSFELVSITEIKIVKDS
jgi:RimJ/RimL family protein N-acetyltransferase